MDKRTRRMISITAGWVMLAVTAGGCSVLTPRPQPVSEVPVTAQTTVPTLAPTAAAPQASPTPEQPPAPTAASDDHPAAAQPEGVLFADDFTDPASGWAESVKYDNYFIGYHEPSYYHVEVHAPNDRALAALPKKTFTDFTYEVKVFTEPNNTAPQGNFRYGLVFRRSGGQYYAFVISPRKQNWQLLKVSPGGTVELKSGAGEALNGLKSSDTLRVDVKGTAFSLSINDKPVGQASDVDYTGGEVGFFVETFDIPRVHIHYDTMVLREVELPSEKKGLLYEDDFTDPASGWTESVKYDNYFIGYHEPSYYHVEVHAPNDRALAVLPEKTFTDLTYEAKVFTEPNNTAPQGNFRYGLAFRRSGGQFYAFVISPREQSWRLLKASSGGTQELAGGTGANIHGLTASDRLRVDAVGANFSLWINDQLVGEASDSSYADGEVGFFVETFDIPRVHIHYDTMLVREADPPQESCTVNIRGLNVRSGPGANYEPITVARFEDRFEPLARSQDGSWLQVRIKDNFLVGWLRNEPEYFTCDTEGGALVEDLPIAVP